MAGRSRLARRAGGAARSASAMLSAVVLTVLVFLLLPWLQTVGRRDRDDSELRGIDAVVEPPPPAPEAPEPPPEEEKPEEEPPPPELQESAQPLDLSALEAALDPGAGGGLGGDFAVRLPGAAEQAMKEGADEADALFGAADLDRQPRVVFQPAPDYPAEMRRKKVRGTVHVVFQVDKTGRVLNPAVQQSTHPAFEQPALQAVRRWRFEGGTRGGKAVAFRMRVPISFVTK